LPDGFGLIGIRNNAAGVFDRDHPSRKGSGHSGSGGCGSGLRLQSCCRRRGGADEEFAACKRHEDSLWQNGRAPPSGPVQVAGRKESSLTISQASLYS
jgi:hypothetical protein